MELGYDYSEDLYVPGYFEFNIKKGESIVFSAGVKELSMRTAKKLFDDEVEVHKSRDSFNQCLINAAHQFHYDKDGEEYIIAGYPWFKARARDTFISLPGLSLACDEVDYYEEVMKTCERLSMTSSRRSQATSRCMRWSTQTCYSGLFGASSNMPSSFHARLP
jgi:glycogen debranching enzyme